MNRCFMERCLKKSVERVPKPISKNIATEMEDEPEDSELHEEGPKHRKAAIRLKPSKFHWYAHGSNSPTMSTENSQLEQVLRKKMLHQTKEESNKDPFAEMMDTVKVMSLPELANLPMQAGRYKGLTCQESSRPTQGTSSG